MSNQRVDAPRAGVGTWVDHHLYSVVASLGRVVRKPFASLLTIAVIALAFTLPLGLWLVLQNVQRFTGDVQRSREISVFLKQDTTVYRARALAEQVRARPDVGNVAWKTPEEGLAELRKSSTLGDALDGLDGNPLPNVLVVTPKSDEIALADALKQLPEADLVQHDAAWRKRHKKYDRDRDKAEDRHGLQDVEKRHQQQLGAFVFRCQGRIGESKDER